MHEVVHLHCYPHCIEAHGDDVLGGGAVVTSADIRLESILQQQYNRTVQADVEQNQLEVDALGVVSS